MITQRLYPLLALLFGVSGPLPPYLYWRERQSAS